MNKKQKKILLKVILSAVFLIAALLFSEITYLNSALFTIAYLFVGFDVLLSAFRNIIRGQVFNEKFLMAIATLGAIYLKEFAEAVAVMLFFQIGELFESIAVGKSRRSIAALMNIRPETACVLREGKEFTVPPEEVKIGETIIIKAGEKIPLDGVIIEGETLVDTASLTGESLPSQRFKGDNVQSGTVNLSGFIKVKTSSAYADSTVAKILELIEESALKKTKTENFITHFARYYTPIVVLTAAALAVIPSLISGSFNVWFKRGLIFLVVSCPCALVVSVPLSFFGGIGGASKKGILIKGSSYIESLSKVNAVLFDKTGTITKGSFSISEINPNNISADELISIAAAAESKSNHPIAKALAEKKSAYKAKSIKEIAGLGIEAEINSDKYYLGSSSLMEKVGADYSKRYINGTAVHIAADKEYLGNIIIKDEIKPQSITAINELKRLGIKKTVMLTGDNEAAAKEIAEKCGLTEYYALLLPNDKVLKTESIINEGFSTAFVGDGINDAPVLARADVGIAMGGLGSDAAIEAADIVIMDDNILKLSTAIKIAKKTMGIVKANIVFALGVKGIILILGAMGLANMWIAVFGDVGVAVIAILNAMRCFKIK